MNSVSATEMAKLGKCEKMIKRSRVSKRINERAPRKLSNAFNGTSDTLRGEFAHFSYESATQRFMTDKQVKC
ncbi:hypothetical protein OFN34_29195, partial [Escherichia coli]|nr:hypothetical protein [Escherichia coli]